MSCMILTKESISINIISMLDTYFHGLIEVLLILSLSNNESGSVDYNLARYILVMLLHCHNIYTFTLWQTIPML